MTTPVTTRLADDRELMLFSLPGHDPGLTRDVRPLPSRSGVRSELRYDRMTDRWVAIAALRQDRTYKPPADQCPLCPAPAGDRSEIPSADYDVAVFENRFPSLSGAGAPGSGFGLPTDLLDGFTSAPGVGRCEVVCFSSEHDASFASLPFEHARLVVSAWQHRTRDLLARPGVAQVFCFENRGEDIGVTLTHPHGQVYAYPYVTPRTRDILRQAEAFTAATGGNLFADTLDRELADGSRIVLRTEHTTAFVPFAARWPVEVHVYPNRHVHTVADLTDAEADDLTRTYLELLRRFDRLYDTPLPYISALHQYRPTDAAGHGWFHLEAMSVRRGPGKLKYLAGSESAMDAFIGDVLPEAVAERLRTIGTGDLS